jgi:LysR family transcriptional regulator, transcriptional activator of the cysJI operon
MHLDALRYFQTVVEEKSISKAANKTHISQSALSQMIQKLEEDLNVELLHRSNQGVTLTEPGEIVLKYANNIIKNMEKMVDEIKRYDANKNKITISGTLSLSAYSLPCMLYKIKKKFPMFSYDLETKTVIEIIHDICDDLSDIGFVDAVIDHEDLIYYKMGQEKVVLIAKADYNIPEKITLDELIKVELIMCTMNKKTCEHLDDALKALRLNIDSLNVIFKADTLSSVKSSVLNGYGMAFVPYESIKHELYEKSIKLVEIENVNLAYDIFMVTKKQKDLSKSVNNSRDYLIEVGRKSFC